MSNQALQRIYAEVVVVERHVAEFLAAHRSALEEVRPEYRASAANLLAYVALRQLDLRQLQLRLGEWGLSSLGRCEGHVGSSLRELRARLEASLGLASAGADQQHLQRAHHLAERVLLGPVAHHRRTVGHARGPQLRPLQIDQHRDPPLEARRDPAQDLGGAPR